MRSGKALKIVSWLGFLLFVSILLLNERRASRNGWLRRVLTKKHENVRNAREDNGEGKSSAKKPPQTYTPLLQHHDRGRSRLPLLHGEYAEETNDTAADNFTTEAQAPGPLQQSSSKLGGMFDYTAPEEKLVGRAYWLNTRLIVAVVLRLSTRNLHQICNYQGVDADVRFLSHLGDMHAARSSPVIAFCTFRQDVKRPEDGVGEITVFDKDYKVPVFDFRPKLKEPLDWVVCVPPLHLKPRYTWIDQMVRFYVEKLRVGHFFIYTSVEKQTRAVLHDLGVALAPAHSSVLNLATQQQYKPYYFGQTYAIHDCLFMNRNLQTKWVMFQDFDEILNIPAKFPTPFEFFQSFQEYSAVTLGTWPVDVDECRPESFVKAEDKAWPLLKRMHKKHAKPYCGQLCRNWQGRRKYVLKPEGHERLYVHNPLGGNIYHAPVDTGHLLHFWSVQDTGMHYCRIIDPAT